MVFEEYGVSIPYGYKLLHPRLEVYPSWKGVVFCTGGLGPLEKHTQPPSTRRGFLVLRVLSKTIKNFMIPNLFAVNAGLAFRDDATFEGGPSGTGSVTGSKAWDRDDG